MDEKERKLPTTNYSSGLSSELTNYKLVTITNCNTLAY